VRRSQASRRNYGEKSRPLEGAIGRGRARASFNRGRDISGTNSGELNRAQLAGHRASTADRRGRAPAKAKLAKHRAQ
jgi:hypothetical protein